MSTFTLPATTSPDKISAECWNQAEIGQAVVEASEHLNRGNDERAQQLLEAVVRHAPDVPVFRYLLGIAQVRRELYAPAIANLQRAVQSDENNTDYLTVLGAALAPEHPIEAMSCLLRAVELGSGNFQTYSRLADLFLNERKPSLALLICETGQKVCGDQPEILRGAGLALKMLGRAEEALQWLQRAEQINGSDTTTLISVGSVMLDLGDVQTGREYFERAVALAPGNAMAHYNRGFALLLEGKYREGFREYEARWHVRQLVRKQVTFSKPLWEGTDLDGRHILLYVEQGDGDAIQFVRYARMLQERGAQVTVLVNAKLARLLGWCGVETALPDAPLPEYDFHCSLLSLPQRLGTELDTIPPPARFAIPEEMAQKWAALLGVKTRLRVGLVWAGSPLNSNDQNRSFPFRQYSPLLNIPNVDYFSLQVGPAAAEQSESGIDHQVRDLAPHLTTYAETAAAIRQLDLVITPCTSVAHLAGSLDVPTWVLLPFAADWRWLKERNDSPWYPSVRLFRQKIAGDWPAVMQSAAEILSERAGAATAAVDLL